MICVIRMVFMYNAMCSRILHAECGAIEFGILFCVCVCVSSKSVCVGVVLHYVSSL